MVKPSFLVIGDIKAGSTSLHSFLSQHPDVYMPPEKELRFFSYDAENSYHARAKAYRVKTTADYLKYFEHASNVRAVGEASPCYLRSPGTAQRIANFLPDVQLIVCLRNPADRLFSLYQMHQRSGAEKRAFDAQLFSEDATWIKGHFYWQDLSPYFRLFRRDRIHVIVFDDLASNPLQVAKGVYRFVGVDDSFEPDVTPQNTGGRPHSRLLYSAMIGTKNQLKKFGTPPPRLRKIWAEIKKKSLVREEADPALRRKILQVCRDDIARTEELVGCSLARWFD
jgi:hypothetical protein